MPHTASNDDAPLTCPVAVPLASDAEVTPAVGSIVDVAGCHHQALQYADGIFREGPVVSDTHGGHLQLRGRLAKGAWSAVYRVTERVQRRDFALKVIPQQGTHITSYYEETRKLEKLKHPNIIEVYDHFVFEEEDSPCPLLCIRLELCKCSLEQYIRSQREKQRPLPTADVCEFVTQLAAALAYVHRQGLLHGDVSSANVLLASPPAGHLAVHSGHLTVKLANFGSSQRTRRPGAPPLTVTGGSHAYAPPEWVNSTSPRRPLTALETPLPSYDLWGLGCVLSEMATMALILDDRQPQGDSLATDPCCLEALKREMAAAHDGALADLCCALLEEDPDERPSAEAVPSLLPATHRLHTIPLPWFKHHHLTSQAS
eukprot:EG_transcript_9117